MFGKKKRREEKIAKQKAFDKKILDIVKLYPGGILRAPLTKEADVKDRAAVERSLCRLGQAGVVKWQLIGNYRVFYATGKAYRYEADNIEISTQRRL